MFSSHSISNIKDLINKNWRWLVIKPVLILYCFQYSITQSITSQVINIKKYHTNMFWVSQKGFEKFEIDCINLYILVMARENLPSDFFVQ